MASHHRPSAFSWPELLICTALVLVLLAMLLPWINRARETGGQVRCANNLRSIGQAMLLYAHENRQQWPRTV